MTEHASMDAAPGMSLVADEWVVVEYMCKRLDHLVVVAVVVAVAVAVARVAAGGSAATGGEANSWCLGWTRNLDEEYGVDLLQTRIPPCYPYSRGAPAPYAPSLMA